MATNVVKQIRKATRRKFSAEEKIRVVLEGLSGEIPGSELSCKYGLQSSSTTNGPRHFWMPDDVYFAAIEIAKRNQ